ncbi:MAG TPA: thiamine pyrophosphate-dependent dehydrogenase E1 component subunit alpha [Candidatus Kapabacteria bacterium]|nr:thiamine pyrophosphate-dependent dehydrogenase E1 component subunit alpha [Candidatus Kapabacteria bacterium]
MSISFRHNLYLKSDTNIGHLRSNPSVNSTGMTNTQLVAAYKNMLLAREFDHALINLYRQSKIVGGVYSQIGNEATSVGTAMALGDGDIIFPMHRDSGAHFVRGMTAREMAINFLFRKGSMTRGVDGTGHFAAADRGIYGNVSHLGAMVPVAAGAALAQKMKKNKNVVLNYVGEGGASTGEVHEGLMMASTLNLPLILIIENNQYAYSTPLAQQAHNPKLSDRAIGYGIPGETVDGTDLEAVFEATTKAVKHARSGKGPSIIESVTMRMRGHAEHDAAEYVPKEELAKWEKKDPVMKVRELLFTKGIKETEIENVESTAKREIDQAIQYALELPPPDAEEALRGVFISS